MQVHTLTHIYNGECYWDQGTLPVESCYGTLQVPLNWDFRRYFDTGGNLTVKNTDQITSSFEDGVLEILEFLLGETDHHPNCAENYNHSKGCNCSRDRAVKAFKKLTGKTKTGV